MMPRWDSPPPAAAPRRSALRRLLSVLALLVVAMPLAAAAALWWWAGTEGSLATALQWVQRSQPLQVQDVSGALRSSGRIGKLTWQQDGLSVSAQQVALSWQPLALLSGRLRLDSLHAATLVLEDRRAPSSTPAAAPTALPLPLPVTLADFSVGLLQWAGPPPFEARTIAGRYEYDAGAHELTLRSLQAAGGSYQGQARLQAYGALVLDARLEGALHTRVPGSTATLPLNFQATLRGPLADMAAQASLQASAQAARGVDQPRATATARITPWAAQPLPEAQAHFRQLDLATLWPQAPSTRLTGEASVRPATGTAAVTASWLAQASVTNALPGPWDGGRLPLQSLVAQGEWRDGTALVRSLAARLGGGTVQASGRWTEDAAGPGRKPGWALDSQFQGIDPAALHSALAGPRIGGSASLRGDTVGNIAFDTALQAAAGRTQGDTLQALGLRDARVRGSWGNGRLALPQLQVRTRDAMLNANLELLPAARTGSGRLNLTAPGLQATAQGALGEASGRGTASLQLRDAGRALRWARQMPGVPADLRSAIVSAAASGNGTLDAAWQGGWRDPALQVRAAVPNLEWRSTPDAPPLRAKAVTATLDGRLAAARLDLQAQLEAGSRKLALQLAVQGRRAGPPTAPLAASPWQASLSRLALSLQDPALGPGAWGLTTRGAVPIRFSATPAGGLLDVGAGEASLAAPPREGSAPTAAQVIWQPVRWQPGRLVSAGRITGLPLAWLELLGGQQLAGAGLAGNLVFDGTWDANLADTLRLRATLARASGDISVLAETAPGVSTRVAAGVREARLSLDNDGERLQLALRWDSERAGTAEGQLSTRLSQTGGAWAWPDAAPLDGRLRAQLPRIGLWSVLAPPGWRLRGSVAADMTVGGTRGAPLLGGTLAADDLALRSVVDGIEFGGGRLRVRLDGDRLLVDEFMLRGAGDKGAGGTLTARGEAGWTAAGPQVQLTAQLERLRASIRTDRQLTVSGNLQGRYDAAGTQVQGKLRVDQASLLLPDEDTPRLGDDVLVRSGTQAALGAKAPGQTSPVQATVTTAAPRTVTLSVQLDLGPDFRVQGHGLDTRLRGTLDITGASLTAPRLNGTVNTYGGQYRAYGQRLDVEQGVLRFAGPPDNPSLDVLAVRPNMTQKVGVQITGSALLPRVRLYAQPDMPDAEKLSWLVIGRPSATGGAEAALLQQAAVALLGSRGGGMSGGLAGALGLDELSFRGSASNADGTTSQGVVTLGKRFSRNFYVAYERSLGGALGTFYVFYDLSRRFTVRGQTGQQNAVDLIFTLQYD